MSTANGIRQGIYRNAAIRRIAQWLDKVPHPSVVCEIAPAYVAAARWTHGGAALEAFAIESLAPGVLTPTAVETNMLHVSEVRAAVGKVFARLHIRGQEVALLVPDPVI